MKNPGRKIAPLSSNFLLRVALVYDGDLCSIDYAHDVQRDGYKR